MRKEDIMKKIISIIAATTVSITGSVIPTMAATYEKIFEEETAVFQNGSFETGDTSGWTVVKPDMVSVDSDVATPSGDHSLEITSDGSEGVVIYQELEALPNTNYVANLTWWDCTINDVQYKVYGDYVNENNLITTVNGQWGGQNWYTNNALFNSGEYEKLIFAVENVAAEGKSYRVDNIFLIQANTVYNGSFDDNIDGFVTNSLTYQYTTEDKYAGNGAVKYHLSSAGYPFAYIPVPLEKKSSYLLTFNYKIVKGKLGVRLSNSKQNQYTAFTTTFGSDTLSAVSEEWQTYTQEFSSGNNELLCIAVQTMTGQVGDLYYIDEVKLIKKGAVVKSIALTGYVSEGKNVYAEASAVDAVSGEKAEVLYQWQKSDDGISWSDISGASKSTYKCAGDDEILRVAVTPISGGNTAYSDILTAEDKELFEENLKKDVAEKLDDIDFNNSDEIEELKKYVSIAEEYDADMTPDSDETREALESLRVFVEEKISKIELNRENEQEIKNAINLVNIYVSLGGSTEDITGADTIVNCWLEVSEIITEYSAFENIINVKFSNSVKEDSIENIKLMNVNKDNYLIENVKDEDGVMGLKIRIINDFDSETNRSLILPAEITCAKTPYLTMGEDYTYNFRMGTGVSVNKENKTVTNNSGEELSFNVFAGAYTASGDLADYVWEKFENVGNGESVSISGINSGDVKIIVYSDDMKIYYTDDAEVSSTESDKNEAFFNEEIREIVVTGKTDISGRPVFALITDETGEITYASVVLSGENGGYEFKTTIKEQDYGRYDIAVGGYDFGENLNSFIYYISPEECSAIIEKINTVIAEDEVREVYDKFNIIDSLLDSLSEKNLAELINSDLTVIEHNDTEAAKALLKKLMLIEAYNENNSEFTSNTGKIKYEDELELKNIDENGVTIYSLYSSLLNEEGLKKLYERLSGKNIKSAEAFDKIFKEEVMLCAVAFPNVGGSAYIDEILTEENMNAAGIDGAKYLSKDKSQKNKTKENITKKLFENISALETEINKNVTTGGMGGGGSSSFSGSSGSGMVINTNNTNILDSQTIKPVQELKFTDISGEHWAYKYIYALNEINVINGIDETHFNPDGTVTREQLVKMLCEALNLKKGEKDVQFEDVKEGSWYERYIHVAASQSIINGVGNNLFGVGQPVTREDLCVMVMNAMKPETTESQVSFADESEISDYAKEAVATLSLFKVISGFEDGTFRPKANCTRAQAAKIIYEIMKIKEVI